MTKTRRSTRDQGCEIIACLQKARRIIPEIVEMVDVSEAGARDWITALKAAGLVRIVGTRSVAPGYRGPKPTEYEWQSTPFALEDFA